MHSPMVHRQTPAQHSCGLILEVELRPYATLPALGHPRNSISAELEFTFPPVGAPGVSNLRYPKLKLSTNETQLVALYLSSKTPPNAPQEPRLSWEVGLSASTINASNQVRTSSKLDFHKTYDAHLGPMGYPGGKSSSATALLPRLPCRTCAELEFRDYGTLKRPGRIRSSGCSVTFKLLFHPERSKSLKLREEVELRECAAF